MVGKARSPRAVAILAATSLPMFMAALDSLVMTFALPVIQRELDVGVVELQWFVNAYTVAFATLMLPMAALGDRFGRRRVFLLGIAAFTLASFGAALSTSAPGLIIARTVQGAGAAAIVPLSLTLLSLAVGPQRRSVAIGIWGGVNGLGVAAGPLIGGAVVQGMNWTGVFWLNVPIGIVAVILVARSVTESKGEVRSLDAWGILLGIAFVLPLIWAVVEGAGRGWGNPLIVGAFVLSAVALGAFLVRESTSPDAFLPTRLFRERGFTLTNACTFLVAAGVFGATFLLSQFLQVSLGFGPLEAGLRASPWTLAPMVVAPLAGISVQKWGARRVLMAGLSLQAVGLAAMGATVAASVPYGHLVVPMLLAGVGMGLTFAPLSTAVLAGRPDHEQAVAAGVNSTLRQLGIAIGVALCTGVFTANGRYEAGQPFVDGLVPSLVLCTAMVAVAAVLSVLLPRQHIADVREFARRGHGDGDVERQRRTAPH